jgi:predicted RecA/RadA family phage recombinase
MKGYVESGRVLTLAAPNGGVVSGLAYKIGSLVVIATVTVTADEATAGASFAAVTEGVHNVVKATGATWSEGQKLYWDDSAKKFTATSGGNTLVGVAAAAAGSSDATGHVRLDGVAR